MKALIQRVTKASVTVSETIVGEIGPGILLLLGIHRDDTAEKISPLLEKVIHLRIFEDEGGKMNRSLIDAGGELLIVSQFTLYGNTETGRRPSFIEAMPPIEAEKLYQTFIDEAKKRLNARVATGEFGAHMKISLTNDGPVTMLLIR